MIIYYFLKFCEIMLLVILPLMECAMFLLSIRSKQFSLHHMGKLLSKGIFWIAGGNIIRCISGLNVSLGYLLIAAFLTVSVVYVGVSFNIFLIYAQIFSALPAVKKYQYLVIFGSSYPQSRKLSGDIKDKLDKSLEIYRKNKGNAKFVLAGKGNSEQIEVESWEMEEYLYSHQIPQEQVIKLEHGISEQDNLLRLRKLIEEEKKGASVLITNNHYMFHVYLCARRIGLKNIELCTCMPRWENEGIFFKEYLQTIQKYEWVITLVIMLWLTVAGCSLFPL